MNILNSASLIFSIIIIYGKPTNAINCYPALSHLSTCNPNLGVNCMIGMICAKSRCRCLPDYRFNATSMVCEKSTCATDEECQEYDTYRECSSGKCECKVNFSPDILDSQLCKRITDSCLYDSSCATANEVCVKNQCKCKPDYYWSDERQIVRTQRLPIRLPVPDIRPEPLLFGR